jgi:hypothetical protein
MRKMKRHSSSSMVDEPFRENRISSQGEPIRGGYTTSYPRRQELRPPSVKRGLTSQNLVIINKKKSPEISIFQHTETVIVLIFKMAFLHSCITCSDYCQLMITV